MKDLVRGIEHKNSRTDYDMKNRKASVYRRGLLKKIIPIKICYSGIVFETHNGRKLVNYDCLIHGKLS